MFYVAVGLGGEMRLEFDDCIPIPEKIRRIGNSKKPGRKHQHRPSSKVTEKRRHQARVAKKEKDAKRRKHSLAVSAYFRGESDKYPKDL